MRVAVLVLILSPGFILAAEPLLKPVTAPGGHVRVQFPLEGDYNHVAAKFTKPNSKQTGTGEAVDCKIALGTFMQAPAVATVKTLESWGYRVNHQQVIVIPEITLIGRNITAKGKTGEARVKITNLRVTAQTYVFISDDKSLDADLWIRVDQLLANTPLNQSQPRIWLGAESKAMAVSYPTSAVTIMPDDKGAPVEPSPSGPGEGRVKVTMALTPNFTMPCVRLHEQPFTGPMNTPPNKRPVAGYTIHNNHEANGLTASLGLSKMFGLKKANDDEGPRVFTDGKEQKILNGKTKDLRFATENAKGPLEHSATDEPVLLDQEIEPPILWVGNGFLRKSISDLTLMGDTNGWKLMGFAKTESITTPVKEKKK
ncbi:hypothetical protein BH11PLA2_BH11PLA2_28820 [soil metagenome]